VMGLTNTATGSPWVSACLSGIYALSLIRQLSTGLFLANTIAVAMLMTATVVGPLAHLGPWELVGLVVVAYVGQDLAHWITGETTFQASYMGEKQWLALLSEHTYYLLPLVLDSTLHMHQSFLSWLLAHNYIVECQLDGEREKDIRDMRGWVTAQNPPENCTSHWWATELPQGPYEAFQNIAKSEQVFSAFRKRFPEQSYEVEVLNGMNEVYVACKAGNKANSDTVFYMNHVDGPYGIFPFCHVYRCMCAVSPNQLINTAFPMKPTDRTLTTGNMIGFDFNREIHLIRHMPGAVNTEPRIVLKLHYVVYPRCISAFGKLLGRLTVKYNENARALFLNTIAPKTLFWKFMAKQVIIGTELTYRTQVHLGFNNIAYVALAAVVALFFQSYTVFLCATSFIHYGLYISHYHCRNIGVDAISFGEFKRNCLFWKSLALIQAACLYAVYFKVDPISIALILGGFGLSSAATASLGWDRTYFGWELGFLKAEEVTAWPYGSWGIPHPMIVGGVLGWLGIYQLAPLTMAYPYLALTHIGLYVIHMAQEHFGSQTQNTVKDKEK